MVTMRVTYLFAFLAFACYPVGRRNIRRYRGR